MSKYWHLTDPAQQCWDWQQTSSFWCHAVLLAAAGSLWRWSLRLAAHDAFIIHTRFQQSWIMNKYERGRLHECYPICDMEVTTVYNTHGQSHCDNTNPWYTACDLSLPPLTTGLGTGSVVRCHAGGLSFFLSEPVLTVLLNESVQAAFSWYEQVCRSIQMYTLYWDLGCQSWWSQKIANPNKCRSTVHTMRFQGSYSFWKSGKTWKSFSLIVKKSGNQLKIYQKAKLTKLWPHINPALKSSTRNKDVKPGYRSKLLSAINLN